MLTGARDFEPWPHIVTHSFHSTASLHWPCIFAVFVISLVTHGRHITASLPLCYSFVAVLAEGQCGVALQEQCQLMSIDLSLSLYSVHLSPHGGHGRRNIALVAALLPRCRCRMASSLSLVAAANLCSLESYPCDPSVGLSTTKQLKGGRRTTRDAQLTRLSRCAMLLTS